MGVNTDVIDIELNTIDEVIKNRNKGNVAATEVNTSKAKDEVQDKIKVDLDTILINEVGHFGWFQLRILALAAIAVLFSAFNSEYVFTTARIKTRCLIPQCDTVEPEYAPDWILNAVPGTESSLDNCQRYGNSSTFAPGACPAALFDRDVLLPCDEYVYETTHSVVYDFELACDEWRRALIGSLRTIGTLLALPITGFVSDRWGRRTALALSLFNAAWLGITRYFASTYVGFLISETAEATFASGIFSTAYILLMEVVGPKYRVAAGTTMNTFFAVGQVTMGLIAWAVPNWKKLTLTLYAPQFICIAYFWVMTESVRWYMSKGRYEESEALLMRIAKTNGKHLSPKSLAALRQTTEEENRRKALEKAENVSEPWLFVLVFRHKRILVRCLVSPVWWITTTFVYYGLSINAVNISGNRYINYVAVSAVEIPGFWTAAYLVGKIGRRPVLMTAYWVCAACQVAYIFLPSDMYAVSLTVYLIAKYSIAMVITSIYVYTAELYPTKYRHSLFAFSSMIGRIGSIVAPLTPAFGAATFDEMPFVLFGSFALISGALILVTPETLGSKLPDTMEEAENIGKKKETA